MDLLRTRQESEAVRQGAQRTFAAATALMANRLGEQVDVVKNALYTLNEAAHLRGFPDLDSQDRDALSDMMARFSASLPQLRGALLTDARGMFILDESREPPQSPLDLGDRDYVQWQMAGNRGVFIGDPVRGRRSGQWFIGLSVGLRDTLGRLEGVVAAVVDPRALAADLALAGPAATERALLLSRSGRLIASHPTHAGFQPGSPLDSLGDAYPVDPRPLVEGAGGGIPRIEGDWMSMAVPVGDTGLVLVRSRDLRPIMEPLQSRASLFRSGLFLATLAVLAMLALALGALRRAHGTLADREAALAEVRRLNADLTHANRELEQFTQIASHDLQEPLRMISSFLGLLRRRQSARLDPEGQEYIGFAIEGANRMSRLINDLLSYTELSRIGNANGIAPSGEAVDHALDTLRPVFDAAGGSADVQRPLPVVRADTTLLTRVFVHLLENSIEYRHAQRPPRVLISARQEGEMAVFSVADNGIGISTDHAERVFRIFQRLHGYGEHPGTGMGLAICRRIIEAQGGRIWIDTDNTRTEAELAAAEAPATEARASAGPVTSGSTLCFSLPLVPQAEIARAAVSADGAPKPASDTKQQAAVPPPPPPQAGMARNGTLSGVTPGDVSTGRIPPQDKPPSRTAPPTRTPPASNGS